MAEIYPVQCNICQDYFSTDKMILHKELHTKRPSQFVRVANIFPNRITRDNNFASPNIVEYCKSENTGTCEQDLQSIKIEELPQPEEERKSVQCLPNPIKIIDNIKIAQIKRSDTKDLLQLNSNLINANLSRQKVDMLEIENIIRFKQIRSSFSKQQQIRTYKNYNETIKVTGNGGRQNKKINLSRSQSLKTSAQSHPESIYLINKDSNKISSSLHKDKKSTVTISMNIRKPQAQIFTSVNTKSNPAQLNNKSNIQQKWRQRTKQIPIRLNQCPDCHGFYCKTCKSTIPPKYRPFWDDNQSPQLIEFYKKKIEQRNTKQSINSPQRQTY